MIRRFALLAGAGLLQAFAPPGPPLRQPAAAWTVDPGETACAASISYAGRAGPTTLALRPSPNGTVVRLVVARPGKVWTARHFPVDTNLSPGHGRTTGLNFGAKGRKRDIVWINVVRADLERLAAAGELSLRGSAIDARFAVPGIATALTDLDSCNSKLRRAWNVDDSGATVAQLARPLQPLASYFTDFDYPKQALREDERGSSTFMLMIDETGALRDCLIEESSGVATLDAMACLLLRERARFEPALDPAGKPVRSVFVGRVVFRIP